MNDENATHGTSCSHTNIIVMCSSLIPPDVHKIAVKALAQKIRANVLPY